MKKILLDLIVCPRCKKNFKLISLIETDNEIKEGILICHQCKEWYPVSNYVPRIVTDEFFNRKNFLIENKNANKSVKGLRTREVKHSRKHKETINAFNKEWNHYQNFGYDEKVYDFTRKTSANETNIKDKFVLDVGCGNGRYSITAENFGAKHVVGIDLTNAIEKTYNKLKNKNISCLQADIFNLPFKENTFDFIFSIGVLHHTQNTKEAFLKLPKLLKPKGSISCTFYRKMGIIRELSDNIIRSITTRLPKSYVWYLSYIPSTISKILNKIPVCKKQNRWIKLDAIISATIVHLKPDHSICFDWWSPQIATRQSWEEVKSWFEEAKLKKIKKIDYGAVAYSGEKIESEK